MKSLKNVAQNFKGPQAFRIDIGESATLLLRDQEPKELKRHTMNGKPIGTCKTKDCQGCAVNLPVKTDYLVLAHEKVIDQETGVVEWQPRTIWCGGQQLAELVAVVPDDMPAATIICTGTAETDKNGKTWCKKVWSLAGDQSAAQQ